MNGVWKDLRYGARRLLGSPGFTVLASLLLALGIGANTAFFSLIDAILLRPFPIVKQSELVAVKSASEDSPDVTYLSLPDYRDFREEQQVFTIRTLGIPLIRGRDFSDRDISDAQEVAIINQSMARQHWPGVDPVGRRIKVRGRTGIRNIEIIGVVLEEQLALALSHQRVGAALLGSSGLLALVLAAIGIYAVTHFSVTQRTREIGLRMALGAEAGDVTRLIVRQAALTAAIGLTVGATAAIALGRFIQSLLFDVRTTDPVSLAGSVALLAGASFIAAYIPAYRAARQDPAASLRHQ